MIWSQNTVYQNMSTYIMDPNLSQVHLFLSVKQDHTQETFLTVIIIITKDLTATQWTHLCILSVHLWDISHPATQGIHRNLITILILPIGSLISSTLHLGFAVRYNNIR
jgi:hypothetical protein